MAPSKLEQRVIRVAQAALEHEKVVAPIDVLTGLGWLHDGQIDAWRQGRVRALEEVTNAGLGKISTAMTALRRWALEQGLRPSETAYVSRTRDRRQLRFSVSGDPVIEGSYRTHWVSPELSAAKRKRLVEKQGKAPDLVVISPLSDFTCQDCGGAGSFLIMEEPGPLCLGCADMDHLVFLPSGDAALTRRAKKSSRLSAVVVRFSRSRKRYERQGILVEEEALQHAEAECLADAEARERRRVRDQARRAAADEELQTRLAHEIQRLFPGCPPARVEEIARHTAARGSGRVGRTTAARELHPDAIQAAVAASVRHIDTPYDELLMAGVDRAEARTQVREDVRRVLEQWRQSPS